MNAPAKVSIIREENDLIADVRISLGTPKGMSDFYLVFRGDPQKVIELLDRAHKVAKEALMTGQYEDHRAIKA